MTPAAVSAIMGVLFVLIVGWDVYLALDGRKGNTISARLREWDRRFGGVKLLISFGFGLLAGHWWWSTW